MGKIQEIIINRWDGGIVNDPRDPRENTARMVTNFDILTNTHKMTPYRSSADADDSSTTFRIRNFALANRTGTTFSLYGLGTTSGASSLPEIYYKDLTTGSANDLDDADWTETANNVASTGAVAYNFFTYYDKTKLIYGAKGGNRFFSYDPAAGGFVNDANTISFTFVGQGRVHFKDNILYVPLYNRAGSAGARSFIAKFDGSTWTDAALTLPDHLVPTSITEFGNFLAIACAPFSGFGNSVVYLWDRDASLTTLSESINFGDGNLIILEQVDGELIGISQIGGSATVTGLSNIPNSTVSFDNRITFRRYVGGGKAEKIQEVLVGATSTSILPLAKQRVNSRLYFMMSASINGATREGVWSIGRHAPNVPFTLLHERTPNNDTALASSADLHNFIFVGDYLFQAHLSSGSDAMTRTGGATAIFNHTSIWESKVYDGGDSSLAKKLLGISITTEALAANSSVIVRYAIDENIGGASWTTILTHDTDNEVFKAATVIESSGAALPEYREIQFRIEAVSGASGTSPTEITSLSFKSEVRGVRAYA